MKVSWICFLWLVVINSPIAENSGLTASKTINSEANRRFNFEELKKTAEEYKTPASDLGSMVSGVLAMVGVDNAVSISLTNNHPLDLTDPHWYIVDGKLDSPPPDVLQSQQTMVITFERSQSFFSKLKGSEGVLTYKMGTSYLLILWSAVPTSTNKLLVKFVNQDPNPGGYMRASDLFSEYKQQAWEAGDYGKWYSGSNIKSNCKFLASMGNGDKAPFEVFLTK